MAPEKQLEGPRITRKGDPYLQVTPSSPKEENVQGQPLHPLKHYPLIFTDGLKEGWGSSKGNLVPSRKSVAYKLPGTKGGFLDPMRVPLA